MARIDSTDVVVEYRRIYNGELVDLLAVLSVPRDASF